MTAVSDETGRGEVAVTRTQDEGEDEIRPLYSNGHAKSEAVPNGCLLVVCAALAFIAIFGAGAWIYDLWSRK